MDKLTNNINYLNNLAKLKNLPSAQGQIWIVGIYPTKTPNNIRNLPRIIGFISGTKKPDDAVKQFRKIVKLPNEYRYEAIRIELFDYDISCCTIEAFSPGIWAYESEYLATKIKNWFKNH